MEFAEITKDPFANNTNNYYLLLDIANYSIPTPATPGYSNAVNGELLDPGGNTVGHFWVAWYQDYELTGSLSDEAYAHSWTLKRSWMLVPPNYTLKSFARCIGFWLSHKEVEQFILSRLSLKGGD